MCGHTRGELSEPVRRPAIALLAPLLLGYPPRLRVPSPVLEIVAGAVLGTFCVLAVVVTVVVLRAGTPCALAMSSPGSRKRPRRSGSGPASCCCWVRRFGGSLRPGDDPGRLRRRGRRRVGRPGRQLPLAPTDKLEALGYGLLVPVFFVASGVRPDLQSLVSSPSALARVPVFLSLIHI